MSETDDYVLDCIKTWVWSGFYGADDIQEMIGDVLEHDADEAMLRAAVESELAAKATAEKTWPRVTDCDRLGAVFAELDRGGVIALQNAGTRCPMGTPMWASGSLSAIAIRSRVTASTTARIWSAPWPAAV